MLREKCVVKHQPPTEAICNLIRAHLMKIEMFVGIESGNNSSGLSNLASHFLHIEVD